MISTLRDTPRFLDNVVGRLITDSLKDLVVHAISGARIRTEHDTDTATTVRAGTTALKVFLDPECMQEDDVRCPAEHAGHMTYLTGSAFVLYRVVLEVAITKLLHRRRQTL
jgi:hypothetical protein